MTTSAPQQTDADIGQMIIEAAEARFQTYGYTKTTMAEIASDTGMSAANLYRYFKNKQDIAAACCGRCFEERFDLLRTIIRNNKLSAGERLEQYIVAGLEFTYQRAEEFSKIDEMVVTVTSERPEIIHKKIETEQAMLAEVVAYGNESGEFDVADVIAAGKTLHSAIVLFNVPIFMPLYPLEQYREKAKAVAELLLQGLRKR